VAAVEVLLHQQEAAPLQVLPPQQVLLGCKHPHPFLLSLHSKQEEFIMKTRHTLPPLNAITLVTLWALAASTPAWSTTPPSTSAFVTDKQETFVQDQTSDSIGQVNQITCIMGAMKPAEMVNKGNYVALVNKKSCDSSSRSDTSGSTDSSSGGDQSTYMRAIVNSTRADNSSPMRVKVWVENEEKDRSMDIFVNVVATQAPDSTNPYGVFRMDFAAPNPQAPTSLAMQGYIDATHSSLNYVERDAGGNSAPEITRLFLQNSGALAGSGAVSFVDHSGNNNAGTTSTFAFAYDSDNFKRAKDGANARCFSRKASDGQSSVWQYGLYDSTTGDRITVKSGFPVNAKIGNTTYQGFMGYYGLSFPDSVKNQLSNGMTITQFDGSTNKNYTLSTARGRLTKFTKKSRTLSSIDHIPFQFFSQQAIPGLPSEASGKMLQAYWDQANTTFVITGSAQCGNNGCKLKDFSTNGNPSPVSISGSTLAGLVFGGMHSFSNSLGGDLFIPTTTMTDSTQPVFYREAKLLYPNDANEIQGKTFSCISNCMTSASLSAFSAQTANSPFAGGEHHQGVDASTVVSYQMNSQGELTVTGDSNPIVWTGTAEQLNHGNFAGGIRSGRLVTDLTQLQCPSNTPSNSNSPNQPSSGTQYCDWKADQVDVYYTWETGANAWNQFAGLKDPSTNNWVTFDPPLSVSYTVPNDSALYGSFAGHSINLQYAGFGQLWGIPGSCVDGDNKNVSCDTPNARYVPSFSIPDTTGQNVVTDAQDSTKQYLVKWLNKEIRFKKLTDPTSCATLTLGSTSQLPDTSGLKDPSHSASDIYIGTKPTLTDAPRVIHGVVQY
jgi:hypothetical protein